MITQFIANAIASNLVNLDKLIDSPKMMRVKEYTELMTIKNHLPGSLVFFYLTFTDIFNNDYHRDWDANWDDNTKYDEKINHLLSCKDFSTLLQIVDVIAGKNSKVREKYFEITFQNIFNYDSSIPKEQVVNMINDSINIQIIGLEVQKRIAKEWNRFINNSFFNSFRYTSNGHKFYSNFIC